MNNEYTISTGYKFFYGFIALALAGVGIYFINLPNKSGSAAVFIFSVLFLASALFIALSQFKRKLIITDTSITSITLFKTVEIAVADIKGYRIGPKGQTLYLESATTAPKFTITNFSDFEGSSDLQAWVEANFTDLDDADYKDEVAHILADSRLGTTTEQRQAQLDRAKYISWAYNGGGVTLFFITLFFTDQEATIAPIVLVYPILSLAVVIMSKGLIKIIDKKNSPYSHIVFGILAPLIAQMIAIGHNHILKFDNFWLPFALMALVLIAVFYYVDRMNNSTPVSGQIFVLLLFGGLYGFGGVQQVNRIYDKSAEQTYQATVLSEYVHHGKNTSYNLRLSNWGPQLQEETVEVSSSFYDRTSVGSSVTIHLRSGFFNIPWFYISQ